MARGKQAEAGAAFLKAVELDPKSVQAHLALATYYWIAGNRDASQSELKAALALEPKNMLTNRALAAFAIASNKPAEAEEYVEAIAAAATDARGRLPLADCYMAMNRGDDAMTIGTIRALSTRSGLNRSPVMRPADQAAQR